MILTTCFTFNCIIEREETNKHLRNIYIKINLVEKTKTRIEQRKIIKLFLTFLFVFPFLLIFIADFFTCCEGYSFDKDIWHNVKFSDLTKFINLDGRYECPRSNCAKHYKDASSLQRHIR